MLWKASLAWTVPCCSVFDWLVGHAGVSTSEKNSIIILAYKTQYFARVFMNSLKYQNDQDRVINTIVGIHVNKGQTCRSLIYYGFAACHGR